MSLMTTSHAFDSRSYQNCSIYLYLTVENVAPRILQGLARYFKISFLENCGKELQLIPIANTNCMQDSRLDEIMMS